MSETGILRPVLVTGLILIAGGSLSACQKKAAGKSTGFGVTETQASTRTEDKFGKGFGKAFRAPSNTEPVNVSDNDVIPVSRTSEPVQVN